MFRIDVLSEVLEMNIKRIEFDLHFIEKESYDIEIYYLDENDSMKSKTYNIHELSYYMKKWIVKSNFIIKVSTLEFHSESKITYMFKYGKFKNIELKFYEKYEHQHIDKAAIFIYDIINNNIEYED